MSEGAGGGLDLVTGGEACQSAASSYVVSTGTSEAGRFESAPLVRSTTFGGQGRLRLIAAAPTAPTTAVVFPPVVDVRLVAVRAGGEETTLLEHRSPPTAIDAQPGPVDISLPVGAVRVPAGSRLRLEVAVKSYSATAVRLLYGGTYGSALFLPTSDG
jgi:predicted acyl esterase